MKNNNFGNRVISIVPGWIYRAVLRNNINVMDLAEYGKIRSLISRDDLSEWYHINDALKIGSYRLSSGSLEQLFKKLTPEQRHEIQWSVVPIAGAHETVTAANSRLTNQNGVEVEPYRFISTTENTFIIVNEGFTTSMNDPAIKFKFVKDYLKELYKFQETHDVSYSPVFELYVKLFRDNTDKNL